MSSPFEWPGANSINPNERARVDYDEDGCHVVVGESTLFDFTHSYCSDVQAESLAEQVCELWNKGEITVPR